MDDAKRDEMIDETIPVRRPWWQRGQILVVISFVAIVVLLWLCWG